MARNVSSLFNQMISRGNTTAKPNVEWTFCPGFTNAAFETLDSSVPYFVNAALNATLAVVTAFANFLVLLAMSHVTSIRLPSKLLLCSLVLTDLGAGLVVQPQLVVLLLHKAIHPGLVQCVLFKSFYFTAVLLTTTTSCLIMAAICLDRYAALFFHLKYEAIVTTRRVCAVLALIWPLCVLWASAFLWRRELRKGLALNGAAFVLFAIFTAYIRIYRRLRGLQVRPSRDQAQQQAGNSPNTKRFKRTASTMMLVCVLLLICYVPHLCLRLVAAAIGDDTALTVCLSEFGYTFVLLNSCLNPLVYFLRLPEVRTEVKKLLRKLCCRSSQQ